MLLAVDIQQSVMGATAYTAYGFSPRSDVALGFVGEWWDIATEGYLLGNGQRLYRPELMRFCSADSISPFGKGGLNSYAYCQCDPVNHVDRSGHDFVRTLQQFFSGVTGLINTGMSALKVATPIIKRSVQAAHLNMTPEQYLASPDRIPEYPTLARSGNSVATLSGVAGLILSTPPGVVAAWQAQSSFFSMASSGTRLVTGGTGMAGRGMQAWSSSARTLADIKQYKISHAQLAGEVGKEMFGWNLLRGRESGIVHIELPEEMRNIRNMPATKELLEVMVTTV
ncbi:RHS repeat-associated core domain-containing protein [Pseudomonas sp. NPDC089408]|uniref:RHS repeat-associated core domain-containing protein n=1 Tax=Pseudomonas sp. NPDC089408 TaxID=3364465 RepID=UPI003827FF1A